LNRKGFSLIETVVFIVLAALVIPIFYLTTQPVLKDMMTPTSWIKARFIAERKMEEAMAYTFGDPNLGPKSLAYTVPCYADSDYAGYNCKLDINYLDCNDPVNHCVAYSTNYKQISVIVSGPQGTYQAVGAVSSRQ
jgi:hypothetical protein